MLHLLETGQALYVLAAICLMGIFTRTFARHLYKRLWKESGNLAVTRNNSLKELKQRAENTYRMNQGMRDSGAWLEHQLAEMKTLGISLTGWSNLAVQWTWLCLLAGGAGAFFSYWYRLDTYYIVMYGGGSVLMAMLTMMFDNGVSGGWRDQLTASLQDYLENVMYPRLARSLPVDSRPEVAERERTERSAHPRRLFRSDAQEEGAAASQVQPVTGQNGAAGSVTSISPGGGRKTQTRTGRRSQPGAGADADRSSVRAESMDGVRSGGDSRPENPESRRDLDYLRHSLEQIAASREKSRAVDENWLKDLRPEEIELIGDILKQYLA